MDTVNPVLPGESRRLTGDASARPSEETGMQFDPMQARLDELLRRLESEESLVRTLQATQVPLNEDPQETAWWTMEAAEPQQQPDDAWWNGYDQWTGQAKAHTDLAPPVCRIPVDQICLVSHGDARGGGIRAEQVQAGCVIMFADMSLLAGLASPVTPVSWRSLTV